MSNRKIATKSERAAQTLLDSLGYRDPSDLTIEEIAFACGFLVRYQPMDGSEGRILMNQDEVLISINSRITYQPKINYILSHEIGHGILHRNMQHAFSDNEKTMSEWYRRGDQETEANEFAVELLMPSELFSRKVKSKKLSLPLIDEVAGFFHSSRTAAFLRYRDLGEYSVMIVFIEDGIITWKSASDDFPYKWLPKDTKVPAYTAAGDFFYSQVVEDKPVKVDAIEWFPEDYVCQRNEGAKLWEQCFPTIPDGILTCLWTA